MTRICALYQPSNIARLARAKGYPYARPSSSFLYISGSVYLFEDAAWGGTQHLGSLQITAPDGTQQRAQTVLEQLGIQWSPTDIRTPVLAVGSNAGPEQLLRKYPPMLFRDGVLIPVVRCVLPNFDVAYSPCITSYGSCSATLEYSPGTAVEIFVTFLTTPQLKRMHETEGAYFLTELRQVELQLGQSLEAYRTKIATKLLSLGSARSSENGPRKQCTKSLCHEDECCAVFREGKEAAALLCTVYQYNHQSGTLHLPLGDGAPTPVAIKEIRAEGRKFPALDQTEMQHAVRTFVTKLEKTNTAPLPINGAQVQNGTAVSQAAAVTSAGNGSVPTAHEETRLPFNSGRTAQAPDALKLGSNDSQGDEASIDAWILENLDIIKARTERVEFLVAAAKPQQYPHVDVLMTIGDIYDVSVA